MGWQQNTMFQKLEFATSKAHSTLLQYYWISLSIAIQAEASKHGLGACWLQHGKLIAFSLKSLMEAKTWYANTQWELLSVIYVCEHCHKYLHRHSFTIEIDHKPLEVVTPKNLTATPHLQRMLFYLKQDKCHCYTQAKEWNCSYKMPWPGSSVSSWGVQSP